MAPSDLTLWSSVPSRTNMVFWYARASVSWRKVELTFVIADNPRCVVILKRSILMSI